MSAKVALAVIIPIFLIGGAWSLGIIEFSPSKTGEVVDSVLDVKKEVSNVIEGKTTLEESLDKVQTKVNEATHTSSATIDNVVKYAQKKVDPSAPITEKPAFDYREIEFLVHKYTNEQRELNGLEPLKFNSEIADIARDHSFDMATREYFSHKTPEGVDPSGRADNAGFSCSKLVGVMLYSGIAENIFQGHLYNSYYTVNDVITSYDWNTNDDIAQITVDGWMNSPGHRKNILTDIFDQEGIGVVITQDDKVYVTQNFC